VAETTRRSTNPGCGVHARRASSEAGPPAHGRLRHQPRRGKRTAPVAGDRVVHVRDPRAYRSRRSWQQAPPKLGCHCPRSKSLQPIGQQAPAAPQAEGAPAPEAAAPTSASLEEDRLRAPRSPRDAYAPTLGRSRYNVRGWYHLGQHHHPEDRFPGRGLTGNTSTWCPSSTQAPAEYRDLNPWPPSVPACWIEQPRKPHTPPVPWCVWCMIELIGAELAATRRQRQFLGHSALTLGF